jgi:FMN phosphatase YigB (HAD superfamily)
VAVSFDCFGTLVTADRPAEPWVAVAAELRERGFPVPDDWEAAYRSSHRDYDRGAEAPLDEHVRLSLASRDVEIAAATGREVTLAAFDGSVSVRDGAREALAAARDYGPIAVCSNCSVPGLVERTLDRTDLAADAVVTSVDCGWRKPHPQIFEATAAALECSLGALVHVGDDARTDGGAERVGATSVLVADVPLAELPGWLEREGPLC